MRKIAEKLFNKKKAIIADVAQRNYLVNTLIPILEKVQSNQIYQTMIKEIKSKYPKLEKTSIIPEKFFEFLKHGCEEMSSALKTKFKELDIQDFDKAWMKSFGGPAYGEK